MFAFLIPIVRVTSTLGDQIWVIIHPLCLLSFHGVVKKQPTVTLSSTETECCTACFVATEAVWFRRLLGELCASQRLLSIVRFRVAL